MNCVHDTFADYARFLGVDPSPYSYNFYFHVKQLTGHKPQQYTWTGAFPWMLEYLGLFYGLRVKAVQHKLWMPEHYVADAPTPLLAQIAENTDWGERVEEITLAPAAYALYLSQHAIFSVDLPQVSEWITIAVQLERKSFQSFPA